MKRIIYLFDEDDKYGAPKAGIEMIMQLKNKDIYPIILTSKKNNINKFCDDNNIENYVTYHHKYTYVNTKNKLKDIIKFIPRYLRYKLGNIIALNIIKRKINLKNIDCIHSNISAIDLGILISKKYNIKNIMHIREFGELDFNMKSYRNNYIKYLNKNVTQFIAISDAIRKYWIEKGISENKIQTIYDGVYINDILTKENYRQKGKLKILMIGSINRKKGQVELVKAISLLDDDIKNNILVDIIGNGYKYEEDLLKKEIECNKLTHVITYKNYDSQIREKIKDYDIGVNCSFSEGFGRVTIEYMIAGLCVIASNTGANIEIVNHNENGLLYEKGKPQTLSDAIKYLFNNYNEIMRLSENAKSTVNQKFTIEINANNVNSLYDKI
ncbi:MAG: glycosyltransferase family 4 protein [Clostridia bacterium]|nr:glycosyltransferase family 4 protein [Clostridia bacterium]